MLTIVTISKDNPQAAIRTLKSCQILREKHQIRQIVVDTSNLVNRQKLQRYAAKQKNLSYHFGQWSGIAKSYNYGVRQVKQGWVWLLNATDFLHPKLNLPQFLSILDSSSAEAIIFSAQGKQSQKKWYHPSLAKIWPPFAWIPQPGVVFKRQLYNQVGPFNEKLRIALDLDYWLRAFAGKTKVDLSSMVVALIDETGLSNNQISLTAKEILTVILFNKMEIVRSALRPTLISTKTILINIRRLLTKPK